MSGSLSPEERERLGELFDRAADLPADEQSAFVAAECGDDAALRAALFRLLAGHAGPDRFGPIDVGVPHHDPALAPGVMIGAYRVLERIGEGGMGEVYAADQLRPVVRRVALKVVRRGLDSAQVLARFEAERQALARMQHRNIAQVHDGGTTEEGRPFFVMELVDGVSLTEFCDRRRRTARQRLDLFLDICAGVQHAHLKGIIHRDLKPSNLIVAEQEGDAVVKIIDFGIARATSGQLTDRSLHTTTGQILGTPAYMSPEQVDPGATDIDTRSDVYSLGVVLYELLTGVRPFELPTTGDAPLLALQRAIVESEPPTPSTRLRRDTATADRTASDRDTDRRSLIRDLSGDLDWICLKAIEKEPGRRYRSVAELADDVRRHLDDLPVLARRPEWSYRARKFVRRHRVAVVAATLVVVALAVAVLGIVSGRLDMLAAERVTRASRPYADAFRLAQLVEQADDELWPPYPERIPQLERWLAQAQRLAATLDGHDGHRADLAAMDANPAADAVSASRRSALAALVANLSALRHDITGLLGTDPEAASPEHGWSVPRRLRFARRLRDGFAAGGEFAVMWDRHPELAIPRQMGLVPIGRDPTSERWEFAHLMTGTPPTRDAEGAIVQTDDLPVILVLMPEDTFWMGAQNDDPEGRNYDQRPPRGSTPLHQVELPAHFVSKYEMTQGQWRELTGSDPSRYRPDKATWQTQWLEAGRFVNAPWLHPVEQVSWWDCDDWLPRAGLRLPNEAEWEHAARAGSDQPFWSGSRPESLDGIGNVHDAHARRHGGREHDGEPATFSDGSTMHAPVGSYRANRFGLHDVHGNVYEWCQDGYDIDFYSAGAMSDPVAPGIGEEPRIFRGGSYRVSVRPARASVRTYYPPGMKGHALGVRPAATMIGR